MKSERISLQPGETGKVRVPEMDGATHFAVTWTCEGCNGTWRRVFPKAITHVEIWCPTCDPPGCAMCGGTMGHVIGCPEMDKAR